MYLFKHISLTQLITEGSSLVIKVFLTRNYLVKGNCNYVEEITWLEFIKNILPRYCKSFIKSKPIICTYLFECNPSWRKESWYSDTRDFALCLGMALMVTPLPDQS